MLLVLLYLGVKNIHPGMTLPAFPQPKCSLWDCRNGSGEAHRHLLPLCHPLPVDGVEIEIAPVFSTEGADFRYSALHHH